MDPLGLGRDIFRLIGTGYLLAAAVVLVTVLVKAKTIRSKLTWSAVVIFLFCSPLFTPIYQKFKFQYTCSTGFIDMPVPITDSGYFVDMELIRMGRSSTYSSEYVKYMLKHKLAYLELPYDQQFWSGWGLPANWTNDGSKTLAGVVPPGNFIRLSLENSGNEKCKGFERWMREYPAQKWPWLRASGLQPGYCVGAETIGSLQSRYRMNVQRKLEIANGNNGGVEFHSYQLQDTKANQPLGTAGLAISTVYEHRDPVCGHKDIAEKLAKIMQAKPDSRYLEMKEILVSGTDQFAATPPLTTSDLGRKNWNNSLMKSYATNIMSGDGTVWVQSRYERTTDRSGTSISLRGYELASLVGGTIYRVPLVVDGKPVMDVTGLAIDDKSMTTLALNPSRVGGKLLVFSRSGEPLHMQAVTYTDIEAFMN